MSAPLDLPAFEARQLRARTNRAEIENRQRQEQRHRSPYDGRSQYRNDSHDEHYGAPDHRGRKPQDGEDNAAQRALNERDGDGAEDGGVNGVRDTTKYFIGFRFRQRYNAAQRVQHVVAVPQEVKEHEQSYGELHQPPQRAGDERRRLLGEFLAKLLHLLLHVDLRFNHPQQGGGRRVLPERRPPLAAFDFSLDELSASARLVH